MIKTLLGELPDTPANKQLRLSILSMEEAANFLAENGDSKVKHDINNVKFAIMGAVDALIEGDQQFADSLLSEAANRINELAR